MQLVPPLTATHPTSSTVSLEAKSELCETPLSDALAPVSTIKESTPTDMERREIANLKGKASYRVIHGKFVPQPVPAAHTESKVQQQVEALLSEFANVFPGTVPLGLPPSREVDNTIYLELCAKPPTHRVCRMSPTKETR